MYIIIIMIAILLIILKLFHGQKITTFIFHEINEKSDTDEVTFENILQIIFKNKYKTYTLSEIKKIKESNLKIPKKSIILTFDDGYINNYDIVFPLLKKYNIKITLFINTKYIANDLNYMNWDHLKELEKSGLVDVQLHTHSHYFNFIQSKIEGVFTLNEIINLNKKELENYNKIYNTKLLEGFPKFKTRGELSEKGIKFSHSNLKIFKNYYLENIKNINDTKEQIKLCNEFIGKNIELFSQESDSDFEDKIINEIKINKNLLESNLNKKCEFFAWPWGHKSEKSKIIIKKLGILGFVTCIKGSNSREFDLENIRRDNFRKATIKKFKIKFFINRNTILSKIYEILS